MPGTRFKIPPHLLIPPSQLQLDLDNSDLCSYHQANPHVYREFCRLTLITIQKGFKHYSAKGIFEILRWRTGVAANGDCFKLNNNYTSFYARMFERHHPNHKGFFMTRKSKFD